MIFVEGTKVRNLVVFLVISVANGYPDKGMVSENLLKNDEKTMQKSSVTSYLLLFLHA